MEIIERNIADLIRAEYNPRELTQEQEKQLSDSLRRFGVVDPVIVNVHPDRKDIIIGGHQRSKVWQKLGNETIPTVELSLTYDQEKELNVRLNKNTGQFDMDMLKDHFETDDLIEWGFTDVELDWQEDVTHLEAEEDDFEVPEEVETDIVQGDLIEIGPHRLLCGDSTNSDDVERLMDGQKADMVFTDPPYGINHSGKGINGSTEGNDFGEILGDGNTEVAIDSFNLIYNLYPEAMHIWWGANYYPSCLNNGNGWLIWDKERVGDTFSGAELAYVNKGVRVDVFRHKWHGMIKASEMGEKRVHPTQKPVALVDWCINNYAKESEYVLDAFLGSGSTMVASHQLNRKCYGMELDPKYCQVIVDRMMKLDPSLSVKINGKDYGQE
jgi:DNA modification methylase